MRAWKAALVLLLSATAYARDAEFDHSSVTSLEKDFDQHVPVGDKLVFVKFYAPWCGHCKRLAKVWGGLADKFSSDKSVEIAHVDCTAAESICRKLEIRGYPTLKAFVGGKQVTYKGSRDLSSLVAFVDREKKVLQS